MAERFRFGRQPVPAGVCADDLWMLETPEGAATLARVRACVCVDSPIDRDQHAVRVAVDALKAKQWPRTTRSRPSLVLTREIA